jgi:hypothetical protein
MKTKVHFRSYVAQFFLEWKIFETSVVEKLEIDILFSIAFFFRKSCRLWDNVDKYCRAGQVTSQITIWRMCFACWIPKATSTHTVCVILVDFPQQQLHERAKYHIIRTLPVWFRFDMLFGMFVIRISKIAGLFLKNILNVCGRKLSDWQTD